MGRKKKEVAPATTRPFKVTYVVTFDPEDADLAEGMEKTMPFQGLATFKSGTGAEAKGHVTWVSREGNTVGIVVEGTR